MISLAKARGLIRAHVRPLRAESASLAQAHGRILREDVRATEDLPAFDRSAMDGYAVALNDKSKRFRIVGEIQPGKVPQFKIKPGECARIFTGAQIPQGASQVIIQEDVRVEDNFIMPIKRNRTTFIRKRGEDARKGDLLLKAGTRISANELALLAGIGWTKPKISSLIRVAHFVTGNEIIAPSRRPKPGQIRDSNSVLVKAHVGKFGGKIIRQERVADDFDLLCKKVRATKKQFDLLLISGGASVGDYDFGKRLLAKLGFQIHFEQINLRPGKPLIFATRGKQAAFVLPGNPVSHFVTLQVAVRLAMEVFSGAKDSWPLAKIQLAESFAFHANPRETFWPAQVTIKNGELMVRALRWQSSGDVTGFIGANAMMQFDAKSKPPKIGDFIPTLVLNFP